MKVKEIERTANIAWSPASQYPVYLATGTSAQQLDASFSTVSSLELYSLNLGEPGLDMKPEVSIATKQRFHKLVWGSQGITSGERPSGVLVGGADQGHISIFDAAKLLQGNKETGKHLISEPKKHSGPVKALDFNPFQLNLLASGATDSEIYIWDLNNPESPMTPGSASQPPDDVTCLAWNRQVQHILASNFAARCVVWDLRKNEPIIKVSDSMSRMRYKVVAWHPEVATQLCLASEEDHHPVIQLWDLRFATSPLKTLEGHQRGILSMAWCSQDPDLLLSCGKDNRVLIWNPNSECSNGEILCELASSNQWSFDIGWCPRNPSLIATASFDGKVGIHSIMGGRELSLQNTGNMIADSFPGMEASPVVQQQQSVIVHQQLKKPPKWLRSLSGASFGFGGKLITFGTEKGSTGTPQIHISQVITEEELVSRSRSLETALSGGNLGEFCIDKSKSSNDEHVQATWNFLAANFTLSPRQQLLQLLGYEQPHTDVAEQMDQLHLVPTQSDDFDSIAADSVDFRIPTDKSVDGKICRALLLGDLPAAVDLCFSDKRYADAIVLAMAGSPELLAVTKEKYFRISQGDVSRLIHAVVTRNWVQMVQHCELSNWKEALATTLTYATDEELPSLCQIIGQRLESETNGTNDALLCYVCAGNLEKVVECWLKKGNTSTAALQELVEQVMVLRKAQLHRGHKLDDITSGPLATELCRYAGLLAGQGSLDTALTYLDMSQDTSMLELKERLQRALGYTVQQQPRGSVSGPCVQQQQTQQQPSYWQYSTPKPATPTFTQDPYASLSAYPQRPTTPFQNTGWNFSTGVMAGQNAPPIVSASLASHPPPAVPASPSSLPPSVSVPSAMGIQHSSNIPPVMGIPPPSQPVAPPPMSGNVSRGGLLSHRNRVYVQDPSVYGGVSPRTVQAGYFGSSPAPFQSNPPQYSTNTTLFQPPTNIPSSSMNQLNSSVTSGAAPATMLPPTQFSGASPPLVNGVASNPAENLRPGTPLLFNPLDLNSVSNSVHPTLQETISGSSAVVPPPPTQATPIPTSNPPPGWNDPPLLTSLSKPKQEISIEPIVHPIFGATTPIEQSSYPTGSTTNYDGLAHEPSLTTSAVEPVEHKPMSVLQNPVPIPLPTEHQVLHDVFNNLKEKCSSLANNPQMKRKLDDVSKKLESLDDRLRNNGLSNNTIMGLHQIIQAVQAGDYNTSLALHTQLVSGTNFTEIGSFMPGIKVLLQMSAQLGIDAR